MHDVNLEKKLRKSQAELLILYEIGNAMRTTLKLNEIIFIILTGVTAHEGLGFNRAMLFLVNERNQIIEGVMGIGPDTTEEAERIWKHIEKERMSLEDLIRAYHKFQKEESQLNKKVKSIKIPLSEDKGIIAMTALEGMPFEVTTEEAKQKVNSQVSQILGTNYFVTVPIKARDKTIGAILADNIFTQRPITKEDVVVLTMLANQAGLAIQNCRLYEQTLHIAHTDSLTRLYNHGYFQHLLGKKLKVASQLKRPLSLIIIDIDNFKLFNDTHGHQAGDKLLSQISRILKKTSRQTDIVARYGGEEFAIVLPETDKGNAALLAERLREAVKSEIIGFTISCGVASFPEDGKDKATLISSADLALYRAKKEGKNRTSTFYH